MPLLRLHALRYHGSSLSQSGAFSSSDEKNYLHTVFRSKLAKPELPRHGDFSAAVAKETQNGILKVQACQWHAHVPLCTLVFTRAQADAKTDSAALTSAAPASLPAWVLKNPNSKFAEAIMRRMAKRQKNDGQVWCGAYVCE
jgi:hypothetical protein